MRSASNKSWLSVEILGLPCACNTTRAAKAANYHQVGLEKAQNICSTSTHDFGFRALCHDPLELHLETICLQAQP